MLFDTLGRRLNYLRISITDRCNLRCLYCLPEEGVKLFPHSEILTYEEIHRVAQVAVSLGIDRLRLTGGEPLLRADLCSLIKMLDGIEGLANLALTTNGTLLEPLAVPLKKAGLKRINISLDTLNAKRYFQLTRGGDINRALAGIEAALNAGLHPVKINAVLFATKEKENLEAEVIDFVELTRRLSLHVRFIEWMPLAETQEGSISISADEILQNLQGKTGLRACAGPLGNGPAKYFCYPDAPGTIGFIRPLSQPFCAECSRLRLTAAGGVKSCLFQTAQFDLRTPLRTGASDEEIAAVLLKAARNKPISHLSNTMQLANMRCIGG